MARASKPQPLRGIRVLDLSQVLAGPYCAMLLAGLGAEVIKVEAPEGDISRSMGPPFVGDSGTLFISVNRNKKSVVLDLKHPKAQAALQRLARVSDVVVHNLRPRAARQLGVDYRTLSAVNPRLVYANVAAFGQSGPDAERPGLDAVFQAMGGLMSLTGPVKGPPMKAAPSVVDVTTGVLTALGIVSSLLARTRTRKGLHVGGALLDTVLSLQATLFTYSSVTGRNPERVGNGSYYTVTNCFKTSDGQLVISLPTSRFWRRLCGALRSKALEKDARFATHRDRLYNSEPLARALQKLFKRRTTEQWLEILKTAEVPSGPVLSYHEVLEQPQVRHNGLLKKERYTNSRPYTIVRSPVRLNGFLMDADKPAPALGEHTEEVLRSARFTAREIQEMRQIGIIVPRPLDLDHT